MGRTFWIAFVALLASASAHAEQDFAGSTPSGAFYSIAVPDGWKPGDILVMYQHGLSFEEPGPNPDLGPIKDLQLSEGYAVAASSYRQRSWALFTAADDNAELLDVFKQTVGAPGAIIPFGASLGGLISLKLAEDSRFAPVPAVYSACPPAAGSRAWDAAIDLRLAYDVICKSAGDLPTGDQPYPWAYNLDDIPNDLSDLEDKAQLLETLLPVNQCTGVNLPEEIRNGAMKRRLAELMNLNHITDEDFFVTNMGYATYAMSDLVRAPDKLDDLNPFSTVGVVYSDAAVNAEHCAHSRRSVRVAVFQMDVRFSRPRFADDESDFDSDQSRSTCHSRQSVCVAKHVAWYTADERARERVIADALRLHACRGRGRLGSAARVGRRGSTTGSG